MKTPPFFFKNTIEFIDENIRSPLGNTAVMVQKIRDGKVHRDELDRYYEDIVKSIVSADFQLMAVFFPYMDEVKNTSLVLRFVRESSE